MARTRSVTKRIAERSLLLDLPAELRCLIFSFIFKDEAPNLRGDMYGSINTIIKEPQVALVSRQIRAEVLPLFYARKAFFFNVSERGGHHRLAQRVRRIKPTSSKLQYMKKATFFGRGWRGQVGITIDFSKLKIIDARWRPYQQRLRGRPPPVLAHNHMGVRHCTKFQAALDKALEGDLDNGRPRAYQAMLNIVDTCSRCFMIHDPKNSRTYTFAADACPLGEQSYGPCECSQVMDLVTSVQLKPTRPIFNKR
jgi:hypothetical protein